MARYCIYRASINIEGVIGRKEGKNGGVALPTVVGYTNALGLSSHEVDLNRRRKDGKVARGRHKEESGRNLN